jgi:hypothetical protein
MNLKSASTPDASKKAPALLSPPAARVSQMSSLPSAPLQFWRLGSSEVEHMAPVVSPVNRSFESQAAAVRPMPLSPHAVELLPRSMSAVRPMAELLPRTPSAALPMALSPNFVIPVAPVIPIVATEPETWAEPQVWSRARMCQASHFRCLRCLGSRHQRPTRSACMFLNSRRTMWSAWPTRRTMKVGSTLPFLQFLLEISPC